jgi:uroporphyrinogen-III synthase
LVVHSAELLEAIGPISEIRCDNNLPVVVPSNRVAETAKRLGFGTVIVADSAMPESMYAALQKVF